MNLEAANRSLRPHPPSDRGRLLPCAAKRPASQPEFRPLRHPSPPPAEHRVSPPELHPPWVPAPAPAPIPHPISPPIPSPIPARIPAASQEPRPLQAPVPASTSVPIRAPISTPARAPTRAAPWTTDTSHPHGAPTPGSRRHSAAEAPIPGPPAHRVADVAAVPAAAARAPLRALRRRSGLRRASLLYALLLRAVPHRPRDPSRAARPPLSPGARSIEHGTHAQPNPLHYPAQRSPSSAAYPPPSGRIGCHHRPSPQDSALHRSLSAAHNKARVGGRRPVSRQEEVPRGRGRSSVRGVR